MTTSKGKPHLQTPHVKCLQFKSFFLLFLSFFFWGGGGEGGEGGRCGERLGRNGASL